MELTFFTLFGGWLWHWIDSLMQFSLFVFWSCWCGHWTFFFLFHQKQIDERSINRHKALLHCTILKTRQINNSTYLKKSKINKTLKEHASPLKSIKIKKYELLVTKIFPYKLTKRKKYKDPSMTFIQRNYPRRNIGRFSIGHNIKYIKREIFFV